MSARQNNSLSPGKHKNWNNLKKEKKVSEMSFKPQPCKWTFMFVVYFPYYAHQVGSDPERKFLFYSKIAFLSTKNSIFDYENTHFRDQ